MYGRRRREPVIAGLLVRKDIAHLARVFARRRHTTTGRCNGHDRLVARSSPDRPAQVGEPPSIGRPRAAADAHRVGPGDSSPSGHEKSSGAPHLAAAAGDRDEARVARRSLTAEIAAPNDSGTDAVPGEVSAAQRADFAGRVEIRGGRRLYLECRGRGRPTVVPEAGTGDLGDVWNLAPSGPGPAVLPGVARFTRVCAYDRPGTYLLPDQLRRSDTVAMPQSARDIVLDLRALLGAAHVPGPLRAGRPHVRRTNCTPLRHHLPPGRSPGSSRPAPRTRASPPPTSSC